MIKGYKVLMWIGIILIILPFLGVPLLWKETILFLCGLLLVVKSVFMKNNRRNINAR